MTLTLERLRRSIDRIDLQLLRLLNRRAATALRIGRLKKQQGLPVFDGKREASVLQRLVRSNPGPLPADAVQRIFRQVLKLNRRLQAQPKRNRR